MKHPTKAMIVAARSNAGMTQDASAKLVFATIRTWKRWEAGDFEMPLGLYELFLMKTGQTHGDLGKLSATN